MSQLTLKGTIQSFSDKSETVKLTVEVNHDKIKLDDLKHLLDTELLITLDDTQAQLNEFIEEAESGEK